MHTTAMVTENLVLLAGDYDARSASRNMELIDLETLESTEITVRDYHPGPRFSEFFCRTLCEVAGHGPERHRKGWLTPEGICI